MATLYKPDATSTTVRPAGTRFTLEELQDHVGGYIELLKTTDGRNMYVHEEGKIRNLPYNARASALYGSVIVGNALVCERGER